MAHALILCILNFSAAEIVYFFSLQLGSIILFSGIASFGFGFVCICDEDAGVFHIASSLFKKTSLPSSNRSSKILQSGCGALRKEINANGSLHTI